MSLIPFTLSDLKNGCTIQQQHSSDSSSHVRLSSVLVTQARGSSAGPMPTVRVLTFHYSLKLRLRTTRVVVYMHNWSKASKDVNSIQLNFKSCEAFPLDSRNIHLLHYLVIGHPCTVRYRLQKKEQHFEK